jgi:hypothetical protein
VFEHRVEDLRRLHPGQPQQAAAAVPRVDDLGLHLIHLGRLQRSAEGIHVVQQPPRLVLLDVHRGPRIAG